jgi:hypothetical protein
MLLIDFICTPRIYTAKLNIGNRNASNKEICQEKEELLENYVKLCLLSKLKKESLEGSQIFAFAN